MIKSVQNVFHLSEAEKVLLLTARPGEGLLLMENEHSEINITASKKEHEIITTNADELLVQKKEIIVKPRKTENKIREGQKAYLKKELSKAELAFLVASGFKEVLQAGLLGKKETYLVIEDKHESPGHIICIKEITDYLKQFTQEVRTYRTAMPDIVFNANGTEYAIEVETGEVLKSKKRMQQKIDFIKKKFGKNWLFFVINRNLEEKYSKLGITTNKRSIKFKIRQIFKNSRKPKKA